MAHELAKTTLTNPLTRPFEGTGHAFEVVDTPRAAMERYGYEVRTWQTRSGEWIAEAVVDGRQVVMVGGENEDAALRYLAGELGCFLTRP